MQYCSCFFISFISVMPNDSFTMTDAEIKLKLSVADKTKIKREQCINNGKTDNESKNYSGD